MSLEQHTQESLKAMAWSNYQRVSGEKKGAVSGIDPAILLVTAQSRRGGIMGIGHAFVKNQMEQNRIELCTLDTPMFQFKRILA